MKPTVVIAVVLLWSCGATPCENHCETICYKLVSCQVEGAGSPAECIDECTVDLTKGYAGANEATCDHLDYDMRQMSCTQFSHWYRDQWRLRLTD